MYHSGPLQPLLRRHAGTPPKQLLTRLKSRLAAGTMEQLSEFVINHWILATAFCTVLGLLLANLMSSAGGVGPQQAVNLINRDGAVVVDVRKAEEFSTAHIIGAINIPHSELDQAESRLRKHQNKPVLVCCASGGSSATAVRQLRRAGVENVQSINGGIAAWRQENLPLVST